MKNKNDHKMKLGRERERLAAAAVEKKVKVNHQVPRERRVFSQYLFILFFFLLIRFLSGKKKGEDERWNG